MEPHSTNRTGTNLTLPQQRCSSSSPNFAVLTSLVRVLSLEERAGIAAENEPMPYRNGSCYQECA